MNNPNQCSYYIDQPISIENIKNAKYPDIVIIDSESNTISDFIDIKTDTGWNRNGMYEFCSEWNDRINEFKNKNISFKDGKDKTVTNTKTTNNLKYHVIVLSLVNSGKKILEDKKRIDTELENVELYICSEKVHPNTYDLTPQEILSKIIINEDELERLFKHLIK